MLKLSALLIALGLILSGCSTAIIATSPQVCEVWQPIRPSRSDKLTDGTAKQIAGNNAANESICGARPAPKPQRVASSTPGRTP